MESFRTFKDSIVYFSEDSRTELPHLCPDVPVPLWKIIKNFIGQDLSRVSLPIEMNEPQTALQRTAEYLCMADPLFYSAATCEDSVRRLALCFVGMTSMLHSAKTRRRKPFNPMLGETFEVVQPNYRFVSEKI